VERIYQLVLAAGYPPEGVEWLRRHRLPVILFLAVACWALLIGIVWVIWQVVVS
jgi:hypothetical protein